MRFWPCLPPVVFASPTDYFRPTHPDTHTQVGNPGFAIVDEAYPYISKRLLTDDSPRLREALRYMIYGKSNVFDVERLIDLLQVGGAGFMGRNPPAL